MEETKKTYLSEEDAKELLLLDLCGRIPYYPRFHYTKRGGFSASLDKDYDGMVIGYYCNLVVSNGGDFCLERCKLYLRPMESMTEKERTELISIISDETTSFGKFIQEGHGLNRDGLHMFWKEKELNWLNSHHFDFRGLIKKGLALEAPKEMYMSEQY